MVAASNSGRAIESGYGAKPSGPWTSPVASGSSVTTSRTGRLDVLEGVCGALAVGHVIEEAQRAVEVVGAGRRRARRCAPTSARTPGPTHRVRDAAGEQRAEDLAGADQREALGRLPPRRVRPALDVVVRRTRRRPRRARSAWSWSQAPGRARRPRRRPGRGSAAPARWRRAGCAGRAPVGLERRGRSRRRRCGRRRRRRARARRRRRGTAARSGGGRGRGRGPRGTGRRGRDRACATIRTSRRLERNGHRSTPCGLTCAWAGCTASSQRRRWPVCGCGDRRRTGAGPARRLLRPDLAGRPRRVRGRARHRPGAGEPGGRRGLRRRALPPRRGRRRARPAALRAARPARRPRRPATARSPSGCRRTSSRARRCAGSRRSRVAAPPADAAIAEAARRLAAAAGARGDARRRPRAQRAPAAPPLPRGRRLRPEDAPARAALPALPGRARPATSRAPRSTPATPTSRTSRASAPASPGGRPPRCCADEAHRGRGAPRARRLRLQAGSPAVSGPAASCADPSPIAVGKQGPEITGRGRGAQLHGLIMAPALAAIASRAPGATA